MPELNTKNDTRSRENSSTSELRYPELQPVIDLNAKVTAFEKNRGSQVLQPSRNFITPGPSVGHVRYGSYAEALQNNQDNLRIRAENLSSYESYNHPLDSVQNN